MPNTPESRADIRKLLYEQVPLLIEKLKTCKPEEVEGIVRALHEILTM